MKQFKKLTKSILAFTLCLSMVLPMVPAMQAEAADLTPPVVENLAFDQKDQTIPANNKTISFTFNAYDSDGSNLSAEHTVVWVYVPNNMHIDEYGRDLKAKTITSVTNPVTEVITYTITFELDSDWEGSIQIRELNIGDEYGNAAEFRFYDHENNTCSLNAVIDIPVNNTISVTDIQLDAANAHTPPDVANPNVNVSNQVAFNTTNNVWEVTLTDTVTAVLIPIEITMAPTSNFQQGDEIKLFFRRASDNREEQIGLSFDSHTQKFTGAIDVNYFRGTEVYDLKTIKYNGETIPCNIPLSYVAIHSNTDKDAPILQDLYFAKVDGNNNLVKQDNGFVVKRSDKVKVVADIQDASKVDNAWIYLKTAMYGLPRNGLDLNFTYDSNYGAWVADVPVDYNHKDKLYATEWYIEQAYLNDIYDNISRTEEAEISLGKELQSFYFIVQEDDGTTSVPSRNVEIHIDTVNGSQQYRIQNLQRVTTIGEILDKRPNDMEPLKLDIDGAQQTGWYWSERDRYIQLNEKIYIDTMEHLNFMPVYDKACVRVWSSYVDERGNMQWGDEIYFGTYGTDSVQDIVDQVKINGIPYNNVSHSSVMDFQNWEYEGPFDTLQDQLSPRVVAVNILPNYKKVQVEYSFQYMNEKGAWERDWQVELFDKGITYQGAIDEFAKKNLQHDKDAQFEQWILLNGQYFNNLNDTIGYRDTFEFVAEYKKPKIPVGIAYYDENDEIQWYYQEIRCNKNDTWQKILDNVQKDLTSIKHSAAYGFTGWNIGVPEDKPLNSIIEPQDAGNGMQISAEYQKYPFVYQYSYLTKDGDVKTVKEEKVVPHGTKIMDYYDVVLQNYPADAKDQTTFDKWMFNNRFNFDEYVSVNVTDAYLAMDYTDITPTFVVLDTVDKDNMPSGNWMVCYTQAGHMDPGYTSEILAGVSAQDQWSSKNLNFKEYVMWSGESFGEGSAPLPLASIAHVKAVFAKAVLGLVYPDETYEIKVLNDGDTYRLPEKYKGKSLKWNVQELNNQYEMAGNTDITVNTPYVIAQALEVAGATGSGNGSSSSNSGNGGNSSKPGTGNSGNQSSGTSAPVVYPAPVQTTPSASTTTTPSIATVAAVELEKKVIKDVQKDIAKAQTGDVITIDMETQSGETATVVPADILEEAKGKDVTIVLDMGGYTWEINGLDIHAPSLKDINLEVTLDTNAVAPSVVNAVANGAPTRQISLTHNGDFGFKGKLSINVGDQYAGQFGNLYYYDSNEKLVFQNAGIIGSDGNVSLEFSHASDYVVVVSEEMHEEVAEVEETEVMEEETTVEEAEAVVEEVQEEAGIPIVSIIIVVVAVILVAAFIATRKRNDEE